MRGFEFLQHHEARDDKPDFGSRVCFARTMRIPLRLLLLLAGLVACLRYPFAEIARLKGGLGFRSTTIHLQFARNLAHCAGLSYNPGAMVTGSTAPPGPPFSRLLFLLPGASGPGPSSSASPSTSPDRRHLAPRPRARPREGALRPRRRAHPGDEPARLVGPVGNLDPAVRPALALGGDPPCARAGRSRTPAALARRPCRCRPRPAGRSAAACLPRPRPRLRGRPRRSPLAPSQPPDPARRGRPRRLRLAGSFRPLRMAGGSVLPTTDAAKGREVGHPLPDPRSRQRAHPLFRPSRRRRCSPPAARPPAGSAPRATAAPPRPLAVRHAARLLPADPPGPPGCWGTSAATSSAFPGAGRPRRAGARAGAGGAAASACRRPCARPWVRPGPPRSSPRQSASWSRGRPTRRTSPTQESDVAVAAGSPPASPPAPCRPSTTSARSIFPPQPGRRPGNIATPEIGGEVSGRRRGHLLGRRHARRPGARHPTTWRLPEPVPNLAADPASMRSTPCRSRATSRWVETRSWCIRRRGRAAD